MAGVFGRLGNSLKGLGESVARSKEAAVMGAEKRLRIERLKIDIRELRDEKEKLMNQLSHRIYERYVNGTLQDTELLAACQSIKMLQMQIDEKWTEVNSISSSGQPGER